MAETEPSTDAGPTPMCLTVVGCAAAWSTTPGRASSAYLVERLSGGQGAESACVDGDTGTLGGERGGAAILLDMGQGSFSALSAYRNPATLDAVLITHAHPDHCIDLVPLSLYLRFGCQPPRTSLLFGPRELRARFDGLTGERDFLGDLPGEPLVPGRFEIAGFEVSVAPVLHLETSFAFRVGLAGQAGCSAGPASDTATAGRSASGEPADPADSPAPGLVYSGDCGRADDLLALIHPGDTLLVEASHGAGPIIAGPNHLNVEEAVRVATAGGAARLVLTHIFDDVDPQAALALARSTFAGETLLAEPGLRLTI